MCIYDETASVPALAASLKIDPNAAWTSKDPKGFLCSDSGGAEDGVTKAALKAGDAGKTSVSLKAKGSGIPMPVANSMTELFDLETEVIVQPINDETSTCWTSTFAVAKKNDGTQFKATTP